jgi:hypothetical protein
MGNKINEDLEKEWGACGDGIRILENPMGETLDIVGWVPLSIVLEKIARLKVCPICQKSATTRPSDKAPIMLFACETCLREINQREDTKDKLLNRVIELADTASEKENIKTVNSVIELAGDIEESRK